MIAVRREAEQVYLLIKRELLSGQFRPGDRVDSASLRPIVGTSHIPVREALQRLCGEGLIEAFRGEGFFIPYVTETSLAGQFEFQHTVLAYCAHKGMPVDPEVLRQIDFAALRALPKAEATARLFVAVAIASRNIGAERAVRQANDGLHVVRTLTEDLIADRLQEFDHLSETWRAGDLAAFEAALARYFEKRLALVPQFVRRLERPADLS